MEDFWPWLIVLVCVIGAFLGLKWLSKKAYVKGYNGLIPYILSGLAFLGWGLFYFFIIVPKLPLSYDILMFIFLLIAGGAVIVLIAFLCVFLLPVRKDLLIFILSDLDAPEEVRSDCVRTLLRFGREMLPVFHEVYEKEKGVLIHAPRLRAALAEAIYNIEGDVFLPEINKLTEDGYPPVREMAARILRRCHKS